MIKRYRLSSYIAFFYESRVLKYGKFAPFMSRFVVLCSATIHDTF